MLVFEEREKPEYPEKNLSEQSREPTNSAHLWRRVRESNPGHIGGRRVLYHCANPAVTLRNVVRCVRLIVFKVPRKTCSYAAGPDELLFWTSVWWQNSKIPDSQNINQLLCGMALPRNERVNINSDTRIKTLKTKHLDSPHALPYFPKLLV